MQEPKITRINPGVNPNVNLKYFTPEEQELIQRCFGTEFYITNQGGTVSLGTSSIYRYFLLKYPTDYQEQFNIEREIVVLFSDYSTFEPRTLDAFDEAFLRHQELRIEKICSFLVSNDINIEDKISKLLSNSTESQVIVPFNYKELKSISDAYFFKNRMRKYFYSRDLFSYESALRKDIYFFGRSDLVHKIANRHRSGENSGLFGLRKSGKTSIIYAVQRVLNATNEYSVYIDCQDTAFYLKRWNIALRYIVEEIKRQNKIESMLSDESEYTEDNCSKAFEKDLLRIKKKIGGKPILIIFDEVERICFNLAISENWRNGDDFIHFWRTMRSIFQKNESLYTYLLVSTNPMCVEAPTINNQDNPIFSQIPFEYIPPFTVDQTKEMVGRLALIMGLEFDDVIYAKLSEDFGGHPFLIRMVCSAINRICTGDRPKRIDKVIYAKGKELFEREYTRYIEMVITVLKEYYNDEYEMLRLLALDDFETFKGYANVSNDYTNHLLGYNIIDKNNGDYFFKVETIKKYLSQKDKYKKLKLSDTEKLAEISERRNEIEPRLRNIIKTNLHSIYGEAEAKRRILDIFGDPRKSKYYATSYKEIFNPNKSEIYFEDLRKIFIKEWEAFKNIFGKDKTNFDSLLSTINKYRVDAHAKDIDDAEMELFRVCATKVENYINDFLSQ